MADIPLAQATSRETHLVQELSGPGDTLAGTIRKARVSGAEDCPRFLAEGKDQRAVSKVRDNLIIP